MLLTLAGTNLFAKQRELRKLLPGSNYTSIYGEDGLNQWYEMVGQSDLFGTTQAIVAHRLVEDLSVDDQRLLAEYLSQQHIVEAEQQVVVLTENEKRMSASPLGALLNSGKILRFPQPAQAKVGVWLQIEAKQLGVSIEKPAAAAMVAKFGGDQYALKTELERWALLDPTTIGKDEVEQMVSLAQDVSSFDLANSLAQRNTAKAIDDLAKLRLQGVPDQLIIGSLAWKLEQLLLDASGGKTKSLRWPKGDLEQAMQSLFQLDFDAKQGRAEYGIGLEMWVVEVSSA